MKKILALILAACMIILTTGCGAGAKGSAVADMVIAGKIITMDEAGTVAEAVAVKDGKIIFVGTNKEAEKYVGEKTEVLDYGSNVIYPGFVDGHSHVGVMATMLCNGAILDNTVMLRQNAETMKKFIEENPGQEVYKGMNFWINEGDPDAPTHEVLDKYASDQVPIVIFGGGGHNAILNQKAIEYFNIKDLISTYGTDGIKVDEKGEPTGYLVETPRFEISQLIPISKDDLKEFYYYIQDMAIQNGYTCVCDAGIVETEKLPMVSALKELAEEGRLKLKIRALVEIADTCKDPLGEIDKIAKLAKSCDNDYFKITGVKVYLDGVVEALTAWTLNPYTEAAGKGNNYYGYVRWNDSRKEELTNIIKKANENGLQFQMHAIGEGAATYGLDCYEAVKEVIPDIDARNGLCHLAYETDDMIKRFADNDVIAYVNPQWSTWKTGTKEDEIRTYGETEAKKMYRVKSFVDAGVITSFHTDGAGNIPKMMFTAATRKDPTGAQIRQNSSYMSEETLKTFPDEIRGEEERLDAITSLRCLTTTPAYCVKEEDNLGSIEVGKSADFVIYDMDFSNNEVVSNVSCLNATLLSMFSNGRMIFPANLF